MASNLPIPVAAQRDPKAVNLASTWVAENGLHCSLQVGVYEGHPNVTETQAWGTILADVVRNVADALLAGGVAPPPREDVINRIWTAFHEELSKPSVPAPGAFIDKGSLS